MSAYPASQRAWMPAALKSMSLVWSSPRWPAPQPDDMHHRRAAIAGEPPYLRVTLHLRRELACEFGDHMPQPMDLLLPPDLGIGATGILHVLLAAQHLGHLVGLGAIGMPDIDREDEAATPWNVIEYCLGRGVREMPPSQ